jgi:potassium efflux system protein
VGIGFGLQAIVNNFVSGLILLFERPIKVGDMVDVDNQVGEVKELGLRATVVQTFDNAEIVIPNSQLISGSVTNWTLTEKKIRVKVPVGVAYGSDIEKVLKILLACASDNPTVLSTPKPVALFLAFGASSLDFELRVWIADFNDKLTILSELNQEIESEFESAGIEIPFPQSDLHLRSIDKDALQALSEPMVNSEKSEKSP